MTSYLLRAAYPVPLPAGSRPSVEEALAWLERTIRSDAVTVQRVGETTLEFRSDFGLLDIASRRASLSFLARGEVEIVDGPEGPVIAVSANPHIWYGLFPMALWALSFGSSHGPAALRWGAALGGVVLGGLLLFWKWSQLNWFLVSTAARLRVWRTGRPYLPLPKGSDTLP